MLDVLAVHISQYQLTRWKNMLLQLNSRDIDFTVNRFHVAIGS